MSTETFQITKVLNHLIWDGSVTTMGRVPEEDEIFISRANGSWDTEWVCNMFSYVLTSGRQNAVIPSKPNFGCSTKPDYYPVRRSKPINSDTDLGFSPPPCETSLEFPASLLCKRFLFSIVLLRLIGLYHFGTRIFLSKYQIKKFSALRCLIKIRLWLKPDLACGSAFISFLKRKQEKF